MEAYLPIIVEQNFPVTAGRLWEAISNADEMRQWYFPMIDAFQAVQGHKSQFVVEVEDRVFVHLWEVIEVDPGSILVYDWTFQGYPGKGSSSFKVDSTKSGAKLTLRFDVSEPFPDHIPEFKRESGVKGWNYLISESLVNYLKG